MSKEFEPQQQLSLEAILLRDREQLETFARPCVPITYERMLKDSFEFNPGLDAEDISQKAHNLGVLWPGESTAVRTENGFLNFLSGDDADTIFAQEALKFFISHNNKDDTFNNFPILIRSNVDLNEKVTNGTLAADQQMLDFQSGIDAIYARAPYLIRARILAPEFMSALQQEVSECVSPIMWSERIIEGLDEGSKHKSLLTGSRIAYALLANVMRVDDLQIRQKRYGRPVNAPYISDPIAELRC
jgi:hypothetical protein